jgi:hypothetical protein
MHFKVVVGICFCNTSIIAQVGYITIATNEAARIGHNTFLVVHLGLHLSSQAEEEPRYVQYGPQYGFLYRHSFNTLDEI